MKPYILHAILAIPATAQTTDGSATTPTNVTCCSLRFLREIIIADEGSIVSATIELAWVDSSGATVRTESIVIHDGSPDATTDDFLTGNGTNGTPSGYLRAAGETPTGETGTMQRRWKRRRLQWLKTNNR